jgi:hypothetical protein
LSTEILNQKTSWLIKIVMLRFVILDFQEHYQKAVSGREAAAQKE